MNCVKKREKKYLCFYCSKKLNKLLVEALTCYCGIMMCRQCQSTHFCRLPFEQQKMNLDKSLAKFEKTHNFKDRV